MSLKVSYEELLRDLGAHVKEGWRGDARSLFAAAEVCARLDEIGFEPRAGEFEAARELLEPRGMWPLRRGAKGV